MDIPEEISQLEVRLDTTTDENQQAEIIVEILNKHLSLNSTGTQTFIDRLLKLADKLNVSVYKAWGYYFLSVIKHLKSEYDSSLDKCRQALLLFEQEQNLKGIAACYTCIARVYFNQGNPEALKNHIAALKIREETADKFGAAASYSNIGTVYEKQGNFPEALKNHFVSLKLREEIGDQRSIAASYINIGIAYEKQANYTEALNNLSKALKIGEEVGDKFTVAFSCQNLASVYQCEHNYPEALKNLLIALKFQEEVGNKLGIANAYGGIGAIHEMQHNYGEGLKSQFTALDIFEQIGNKTGIATSHLHLGNIYYLQKNYSEALSQQLQALKLSDDIQRKEIIKDACFSIAETYKALGDFENAIKYIEKYHSVETEMLGEQAQKQLINLNFMHNMEQTKKQMEIDRLKIVELDQQVSVTEMKALRSQMNPHFIFNALQSIQNFITAKNTDDANTYLLKFSKLMRLVLENSMYAEVSLHEDLKALELYMQLESLRLRYPFTYEIIIDKNLDTDEVPIPPLILQPFVENSIWHGLQYKTEPGHLLIKIDKVEDTLICTVEDNGVGREAGKASRVPVLHKKKSLGMKLTKERLNMLNQLKNVNAGFNITDLFNSENKPAGTRVELSLPFES